MKTLKNLNEVSATLKEAQKLIEDYETKTEKVLDVLIENGGEMRAREIAKACGYGFTTFSGEFHGEPQTVTHPLHWLMELGLVERVEKYEGEPIEIELYGEIPQKTVVVDGVTYYAERTKKYGYYKKMITPKIIYFRAV